MITIRSILFVALFYAWSTALALAMIPLLLTPRRWMIAAMRTWAQGIIALLRLTCQIRVEFRGLRHLDQGAALIGAKHQCMFDTMGPLAVFTDACYVMKKELTSIPFFGWYCLKAGMISIDRAGQAATLRKLLADGRAKVSEGRQLVIFPEGTRTPPGETGVYQPGVAGLYRALNTPCVPLATNSGAHWPAHGFLRRPGIIVYEFLEPIPSGLPREVFMETLQSRIEAASAALLEL